MFGVLARERHRRVVDAYHNKLIRETVLGIDEDEETGEVSLDDVNLLLDINGDDENDEIQLTPEEDKVIDEILNTKDVAEISDEELNSLTQHVLQKLGKLDENSDCGCE